MEYPVQQGRRHVLMYAPALWLLFPNPAAAQALSAAEAQQLRAELAALKAQVQRMEARLDATAAQAPLAPPATTTAVAKTSAPATKPDAAQISWRSAPRIASKDGSAFEPIGRLQYDMAYVGRPRGVTDRGLGFSNEARRIRLGGEGSEPGGFGYKLEVELSDNQVDLVDAFVSYERDGLRLRVGNHNSYQSLDELIGDTSGATMERAAFTDAFGFERRLGISAEYHRGIVLAQAGIFSDSVSSLENGSDGRDGGDENNSYGLDGRLVLAPKLGDLQLHLAGSMHWRDYNRLSEAPITLSQRPYTHTTNSRPLSTGGIPARGETHGGLEIAGVQGPLHFATEVHQLRLDRIDGENPVFTGAYAEIGYFLTRGDTRPYRDGIFQRPTPARPVNDGGIGSVQVTLRYDYLDLNDRGIRGGRQNGYIGALIWSPVPYLRLNLNYARMDYDDPALKSPLTRDYGIDVVAARIEFDY